MSECTQIGDDRTVFLKLDDHPPASMPVPATPPDLGVLDREMRGASAPPVSEVEYRGLLETPGQANGWATAIAPAENILEGRGEPLEQRRQELVALVVHELRNPLTAIMSYAQGAQRGVVDGERALTVIVDNARQLKRIIDDLVDRSDPAVEQVHLEPGELDLAALAGASLDQARLTTRRHHLHLESPDWPLRGWWDRGRLAQVFANLLGNAIKYSPAGGEIVVRLEDLGSRVRVSVRDQGIGIAPEELPHLFDRSYRVAATAARTAGLGLGLHIARNLIEAHSGALSVGSVLGQGTTFSFTLPLVGPAPTSVVHRLNGTGKD
jgi:two-component system, OmpR family, sensor histidine kinase BaeS